MNFPLKKVENPIMQLLVEDKGQEKSLNQNNLNQEEQEEETITIANDDDFEILNPYYKNYNINQNINNINLKEKITSNKNTYTNNIINDELEDINKYNNIVLNKNVTEEEQLRFDFLKEFTKLRPNSNENFLERMKFDVNNRQIKEKKMNDFIYKTKMKMNEEERVKSFNRLIEDTNRRTEAKEKIKMYKEQKEEEEIKNMKNNINKKIKNKKYSKEQWKDIYNKRFGIFLDNKNKKIKEKIIEKEINEKKKEDDIINKYKSKKLPEKEILNKCKKLYNDYMVKKSRLISKKKEIDNLNSGRYNSLDNKKEYKLKRNKSEVNNKRSKNRGINKIINDNSYLKRINMNLMYKNNKNMNKGCFTPPSYKYNINFNNKGKKFYYKGKYLNIANGSISELVINTFFVNQKNK